MPSSLSINGRLFIPGEDAIMAYDAYNGTFLWKKEIPGSTRVRADVDGGNIVAAEDALYVATRDKCYRLNPATGETTRIYEVPGKAEVDTALPDDVSQYRWGYLACDGNILFGSTTMPLMMEYADAWEMLVDNGRWISPEDIPFKWTVYENYITSYMSKYPVPDEQAKAAFHRDGLLWGAMTVFPFWNGELNPIGTLTDFVMVSDSIFAVDTETGKRLWVHPGDKIAHITTTIGDGKIFFAESSVTEAQREEALKYKQRLIERNTYEEDSESILEPGDADVRLIVALDIVTGKRLWERPIDLTGCGGDKVGAAYHDGILLFFGHFSNHDRAAFDSGSLKWRRLTALSAQNGEVLWSRPLNYRRRPLIVGDTIIIEPRACDIRTGKIKMRTHPITGEQVPWEFLRPGGSCGVTSASPNCLFYRSNCVGIFDLLGDSGLSLFGAIRPGCWLELISANGLLLFPEASSGCTCSYPIKCSVAMTPKNPKKYKKWTVFIGDGPITPVKHLAINLGAPGDMKDNEGTLWFGYPRPKISYGVKFELNEKVAEGMGYFCHDFKGTHVEPAAGWFASKMLAPLFTSGYLGLLQCEVPLIDDNREDAALYTIRLGFVAPSGDEVGQRVFDVRLQGDVVLKDFDILREAGAPNKALIKEFNGIKVVSNLVVVFVPKTTNPTTEQAPILNFIEAAREDIGRKASTLQTRSKKGNKNE